MGPGRWSALSGLTTKPGKAKHGLAKHLRMGWDGMEWADGRMGPFTTTKSRLKSR
jgi:hypothetical protein